MRMSAMIKEVWTLDNHRDTFYGRHVEPSEQQHIVMFLLSFINNAFAMPLKQLRMYNSVNTCQKLYNAHSSEEQCISTTLWPL